MDGMYAGFAGAKTGHRHMALRGRFLIIRICCHFLAALAPPGRGHPHPVLTGDVNFGLFTTAWDHLLGTFYCAPERVGSDTLGIGDRPNYPRAYVAQLLEPFRKQTINENVQGTDA